jgi:hypothetical protein
MMRPAAAKTPLWPGRGGAAEGRLQRIARASKFSRGPTASPTIHSAPAFRTIAGTAGTAPRPSEMIATPSMRDRVDAGELTVLLPPVARHQAGEQDDREAGRDFALRI